MLWLISWITVLLDSRKFQKFALAFAGVFFALGFIGMMIGEE